MVKVKVRDCWDITINLMIQNFSRIGITQWCLHGGMKPVIAGLMG